MTFEEYMGVESASVEWQEAKQRLFAHMDNCPICREHIDCSEAVRLMSALTRAAARQKN
jgi:hypothetical protein